MLDLVNVEQACYTLIRKNRFDGIIVWLPVVWTVPTAATSKLS